MSLQERSCELCEREVVLTFHHLVPKKTHKRGYVQRQFEGVDLNTYGLYLCKDCHVMIHKKIDHNDLSLIYNTKEKLLAHEEIAKFVRWVKKQRKKAKRK